MEGTITIPNQLNELAMACVTPSDLRNDRRCYAKACESRNTGERLGFVIEMERNIEERGPS